MRKNLFKFCILAFVGFGLSELTYRFFFGMPVHLFPFHFDSDLNVVTNRPFFADQTLTLMNLDITPRLASDNELPEKIKIYTDSYGLRTATSEGLNFDSKYTLILGDSISFGWPLSYNDSHLAQLNKSGELKYVGCGFLGSTPTQIREIIKKYCRPPEQHLQSIILQITLNDNYSIPDSAYIDQLSPHFTPLMSYYVYGQKIYPGQLSLADWHALNSNPPKDYNDFALAFFNDVPPLYSLALARQAFNIWYSRHFMPRLQQQDLINSRLRQDLLNVSIDLRASRLLKSILDIQSTYQVPLAVYFHPAKGAGINLTLRDEYKILEKMLNENGISVYNQLLDPDFIAIKDSYYLRNDFHPNKFGYEFIAKKIATLNSKIVRIDSE